MKVQVLVLVCLISIIQVAFCGVPACTAGSSCCLSAVAISRAGFTREQVNVMTAISYYESSFGTNNGPNRNSDGSFDYGLLQINSYVHCSLSGNNSDCCCPGTYPSCRTDVTKRTCACTCRVSCASILTNRDANANCARTVYSSAGCGGYRCWAGYNSNVANCDSYVVSAGGCAFDTTLHDF